MTLGKLAGVSITRADVHIPAWGRPWADVDLADVCSLAPGDSSTLSIADQTIACTVVSGGSSHGYAAYRLVAGAYGWQKTIKRRAYRNDAGLRDARLIADAAQECGETFEGGAGAQRGTHYDRPEAPASDVLNLFAPNSWRIDLDGVTRLGRRPTTTYEGRGVATKVARDDGVYELEVDALAGLLPGVRVTADADPAADVEWVLRSDSLRARVYTGNNTRRAGALQKIVEALFPQMRYRGAYEFRVESQSGNRYTVSPMRVSTGFTTLAGVRALPGVPGFKATVLPGARVVVQFLDADPTRPIITNFDDPDSPGWEPLELQFGNDLLARPIARIGDVVVVADVPGTITASSTSPSKFKSG